MIRILLEKEGCVFVCKDSGTESEKQLPAILREETGRDFWPVHRLDKDTGGLLLLASDAQSAADLSARFQKREIQKEYLCLCEGVWEEKEGTLEDLLFHDRTHNKTYVVKSKRKGVRKAVLSYQVMAEEDDVSLVKVRLETGRTHQIRIQFASRRHPLLGDRRYGSKRNCPLALWAMRLILAKEKLDLCLFPPETESPWDLFQKEIEDMKKEEC